MDNWFKYTLREWPRTMTRKEYKAVSHWLRYCAREVRKRIDLTGLRQRTLNMLTYGTTHPEHNG